MEDTGAKRLADRVAALEMALLALAAAIKRPATEIITDALRALNERKIETAGLERGDATDVVIAENGARAFLMRALANSSSSESSSSGDGDQRLRELGPK